MVVVVVVVVVVKLWGGGDACGWLAVLLVEAGGRCTW